MKKITFLLALLLCGVTKGWAETFPTEITDKTEVTDLNQIKNGGKYYLEARFNDGKTRYFAAANSTNKTFSAENNTSAANYDFEWEFVQNPDNSAQYALKTANGKYLGTGTTEGSVAVQTSPYYFNVALHADYENGFSLQDPANNKYFAVQSAKKWYTEYVETAPAEINSPSLWTLYVDPVSLIDDPETVYNMEITAYQTIAANAAAGTIGMQPLNVNQAKLNELNALLAKSFSELNLTSVAEVNAYISETIAPAATYSELINPLTEGYYRFHNVNRGKNLGIRATDGRPMGVDADTKDLSQVWKWEASGTKFKLSAIGKHLGTMTGGSPAPAATMEDDGQEYFIRPVEDFSGQFRFAYGNDQNDCINMENAGFANGDYVLTRWGGDYSTFTAEIVKDITVDLTAIGENTYATFCLPFDAELTTEGVTAYQGVMSDDNTVVNVTAVEGGIAAGEGVVLVGETAEATTATFNLSAPAANADFSANAFEGTYVNLASDGNIHVLNTGNQGVGFYKLDGTLAPYRAYLNVTTGGSAVKLAFGGNVTGIESIDNGQLTIDNDAPIYDLSGRKVLAPAKGGIYVKGGKKIIF